MQGHKTYVTASLIMVALFAMTWLNTGCGEEGSLPVTPGHHTFLAPGNGNAYGKDRIPAINIASGVVVQVPQVAVDASPVLEPVDLAVEVDGTVFFVSLVESPDFNAFYCGFTDAAVAFACLSLTLDDDDVLQRRSVENGVGVTELMVGNEVICKITEGEYPFDGVTLPCLKVEGYCCGSPDAIIGIFVFMINEDTFTQA